MNPLISVIIPMYNRENTINRAIDSVLEQSYGNVEIIVVDDASTDGSINQLKKYKEKVKVISLEENHGAGYARNVGVDFADGEYVAFQDSDDCWYKNKLEIQMKYMLDNRYIACFCPYIRYSIDKRVSIVPSNKIFSYEQIEDSLKKILTSTNIIGTPTLVIKKSVFMEIGKFDISLSKNEDYEFAIRLIKNYDIGFVSEPLMEAYLQEENSITLNNDDWDAEIKILNKHHDFLDLESNILRYCQSHYFEENENVRYDRIDEISRIVNKNIDVRNIVLNYYYKKYKELEGIQYQENYTYINNLEDGKFIIYGAGEIGERAYNYFEMKGKKPRCFVETTVNKKKELHGITIVGLNDIKDKSVNIVVAAGKKNRLEIIESLINGGYYNFRVFEEYANFQMI